MNPLRTIIVEDEEMAMTHIKRLCSKTEDLEVVETFTSGFDAMKFLKEDHDIDLILLDVEMPDFTGLDLLKILKDPPQVIFTTSKNQYAVDAFEFQATDFLTKPIQAPRFLQAIDRARQLVETRISTTNDLEQIFIRVDGRYIKLDLNEILYVETLGDYVTFVTESGEKLIVHSTLKNIDEKLKSDKFIKVHRSFIVNVTKIVDIEEYNLVIDEKVIPISRTLKPILMNKIKTI
ncbi:MAG: LytTR family DNA-binding domain-containing protein [Cytophagales bacterium]|nr:LytTR family DNA-binding domain-containing protein [Cytophagales bacterium]